MHYVKLKDGQDLLIRPAKRDDAEDIIQYVNLVCTQSDNLTFGKGEFDITLEKEKELIDSIACSDNQLMLTAYLEDRLVGFLNFSAGSRPRIKHAGEFGVSVLKEYWGLGIGTALVEQLIDRARQTRIIRKINLRVRNDNHGAIRMYQKLGFNREGVRSREFLLDGHFYDVLCMGLMIDPLT